MNEATPSTAELIERALRSDRQDVLTSMPGEVVDYDSVTQTATIRPCLKRVVFDANDDQGSEVLPDLPNVPVEFPGGAGLTIHWPLEQGDTGWLEFSTFSISEWQATGNVSAPGDLRTHGLGSATFRPGARHKKNAAPDTDVSIGLPGGLRIHFGASTIDVGLGGDFVALAAKVAAELAQLKTHIASAAATEAGASGLGGMTALNGLLSAWPSPAGVGSSNLKADP